MLELMQLPQVAAKAVAALNAKNIAHAHNDNAQTFLVRSTDAAVAEAVLVNTVTINGVTVVAKPGAAWSVFELTVPLNVPSNEQYKEN